MLPLPATRLLRRRAPRPPKATRRPKSPEARAGAVARLAGLVAAPDDLDAGHVRRVGELAAAVALALGLEPAEARLVGAAAVLHDVGKLTVRDALLRKPGLLTECERGEVERHAEAGCRLLAGTGVVLLDRAAVIARSHHERWDGTGYPDGIAGEAIPLEARIVAVVDVFDALTSDRPYRRALPLAEAVSFVDAGRGARFDPRVVDAFLTCVARLRPRAQPTASTIAQVAAQSATVARIGASVTST